MSERFFEPKTRNKSQQDISGPNPIGYTIKGASAYPGSAVSWNEGASTPQKQIEGVGFVGTRQPPAEG